MTARCCSTATHDSRFRTLRSHKNRFGAVNELGVFAMTEQGLREVSNPSAIFLSRGDEVTSGSSVMVVWEGTRPLLVEIQALVDHSMMANPRRVAVGLEQNRLAILLAVLHRHGGLQMADQDVFVNVVGGVKVTETSADLATATGNGFQPARPTAAAGLSGLWRSGTGGRNPSGTQRPGAYFRSGEARLSSGDCSCRQRAEKSAGRDAGLWR